MAAGRELELLLPFAPVSGLGALVPGLVAALGATAPVLVLAASAPLLAGDAGELVGVEADLRGDVAQDRVVGLALLDAVLEADTRVVEVAWLKSKSNPRNRKQGKLLIA